jgi:hypothetical protein
MIFRFVAAFREITDPKMHRAPGQQDCRPHATQSDGRTPATQRAGPTTPRPQVRRLFWLLFRPQPADSI